MVVRGDGGKDGGAVSGGADSGAADAGNVSISAYTLLSL